MSNLELLHYASQQVKAKPAKDRSRRIALFIVGSLLLGAIIAGSVWLKSSKGSIVPAAVMDVVGEEPGFTVSRGSGPYGSWWEITNIQSDKLIVNRMRLNDEFDTPTCTLNGNRIATCGLSTFPIALAMGESLDLSQNYLLANAPYQKQVIFVDVFTNRGSFRYEPKTSRLGRR